MRGEDAAGPGPTTPAHLHKGEHAVGQRLVHHQHEHVRAGERAVQPRARVQRGIARRAGIANGLVEAHRDDDQPLEAVEGVHRVEQ